MRKIKTVIFDFDGTLADTIPYTFKKIIEIAHKTELSQLNDREIINEIRTKDYRELIKGFHISWLKMPFILGMIKKMQIELGQEIETIKLFPAIKALLFDLVKNDFQLGILSSNIKESIDRHMKINKIDVFDFIDCQVNLFGKAESIKNIMKTYKLDKDEVIYIGDEMRDIEASHKAGIKIICVAWGMHTVEALKSHGADYIVNKPSEILKIVKKSST